MLSLTDNVLLNKILSDYKPSTSYILAASRVRSGLAPIIRQWAGKFLLSFDFSGSFAKGTIIRGSTDVDLFISLSPRTQESLEEIYKSLFNFLQTKNYHPSPQNVSMRLVYQSNINELKVDIIPAKKLPGFTNDHSLFSNKSNSWIKTNVRKHIDLVKSSRRLREIKLLKIWRDLKNIEFPSFYLELTVMEALKGKPVGALANNNNTVFDYLIEKFPNAQVVDPANSNNIISDELTAEEKKIISRLAEQLIY